MNEPVERREFDRLRIDHDDLREEFDQMKTIVGGGFDSDGHHSLGVLGELGALRTEFAAMRTDVRDVVDSIKANFWKFVKLGGGVATVVGGAVITAAFTVSHFIITNWPTISHLIWPVTPR